MDIAHSLFYNKAVKKISSKRSSIKSIEQTYSLSRETSVQVLPSLPSLNFAKPHWKFSDENE
jgi:hypothetical protein